MAWKKYVNVNPELIDFPNALGRRYDAREYIHGCAVCQVLLETGEFPEPQNIKAILEATEGIEEFNKICLQSSHCSKFIDKLMNGKYKAKYAGGVGDDDIFLGSDGEGRYYTYEGKHRVCAAKRFGIKEIPVILEVSHND